MPIRWYINPWESVTKGGHTILHGRIWNYVPLDATGIMQANVVPGPAKNWTLSGLDAPDAVHDQAVLDAQIVEIPFRDSLGNYLDPNADLLAVTSARRTAIANALAARRVPALVLTDGAPRVRHVLRFLCKFLHIVRQLGEEFPEVDLTTTFGDLSPQRQAFILDWAQRQGIDTTGLSASTTIEQALYRLALYFRPQHFPVLCGVTL